MGWLTLAPSTIFAVEVSPPPPLPLPAGMSTLAISAPLRFFRLRVTVVSSSLRSASMENTVPASTSLNLPATTLFCTGFVLVGSRLESTSTSFTVREMLPWASGVTV